MKLLIIGICLMLSGCISRSRYLDYGRDCRDNGEKVGIAKAQSKIDSLSLMLKEANEELDRCMNEKKENE